MNIKSLILGSAAAMVAVSGARAADAVVLAEPEPVEYVRICDAYGTGFFYIPGTETCLRISGYVRHQIRFNENYNAFTNNVGVDGFRGQSRARINFDARSDTEWGTLAALARVQAGDAGGISNDVGYGADQAYLQLGGFYAGYSESAWVAPIGLPGIARFGFLHTDNGGSYAYQQRQQIGYQFNNGGFFGSITLEDDDDRGAGDTFIPDVVGNIGFTQAWGGVWVRGAYDEIFGEGNVIGGVHFNFGPPGTSIRFGGHYSSGPNFYAFRLPSGNANGFNGAGPGLAEWSLAASLNYAFNPTLSATIGVQYLEGFVNDNTAWNVEAAIVWTPVTNFEVRLEGYYNTEDNNFFTGFADEDNVSGFLRFTRYF